MNNKTLPIILMLILVPFVLAHTTPTGEEQDIIDGNAAPTTSLNVQGCEMRDALMLQSTNMLVIAGAGRSGEPGTAAWHIESADIEDIDFTVTRLGEVLNIRTGVTAHLLFHENISSAGIGIGAPGQAFWAAVHYSPNPDTTSIWFTVDPVGGTPDRYALPSGALSGAALTTPVSNYTSAGCGGGTLARLFDLTELTPPQNFTAIAQSFQNYLSWDPPLSNGSGPVLGYNIYREDSITETPVLYQTLNDTEFLDDNLACNNPGYNYSITAFNSFGESEPTPWSGFLYPLCRSNTLFGENGQIFGPGGKEGLGETLGVSTTAAGMFWGIIITIGIMMLGYILFQGAGAVVGAIVGIALSMAWTMFPLWVVMIVIALSLAIFIVIAMLKNSSQGES